MYIKNSQDTKKGGGGYNSFNNKIYLSLNTAPDFANLRIVGGLELKLLAVNLEEVNVSSNSSFKEYK